MHAFEYYTPTKVIFGEGSLEKLPELSYNISGERELSIHELLELIGQYMGKKVRFISAPMWLGVFGAKAVKLLSGGKVDMIEKVLGRSELPCSEALSVYHIIRV